MDLLFEFLQRDIFILLAVTAIAVAIAVAALWALGTKNRKT